MSEKDVKDYMKICLEASKISKTGLEYFTGMRLQIFDKWVEVMTDE